MVFTAPVNGYLTIFGLTDNLDATLIIQDAANSRADQGMVIN